MGHGPLYTHTIRPFRWIRPISVTLSDKRSERRCSQIQRKVLATRPTGLSGKSQDRYNSPLPQLSPVTWKFSQRLPLSTAVDLAYPSLSAYRFAVPACGHPRIGARNGIRFVAGRRR